MDALQVLLIDDEEELVSTMVERLAFRGVEAEYALDGPHALEKMRTARFDVVVLDLKLPGMSGTEVIQAIKAEYPGVPVIMITGHGASIEQVDERPAEAYDYLAKPISLETLVEKIQEAAGRK